MQRAVDIEQGEAHREKMHLEREGSGEVGNWPPFCCDRPVYSLRWGKRKGFRHMTKALSFFEFF